jgi:Ca-activated chloride channel homolog
LAIANKIEGGVNRILLATDGDFNVGQFSQDALKEFVSKKRESGVTLSTLGFGADNYNDAMAEQLADVGNGKYAYIDTLPEAQKVLGREIAGSLFTIASDVKIQIEFNPKVVAEYRLIGYDNRMLAREDFNNDKVDAGDIGAGHKVTALYEITRVGGEGAAIDPLRYASGAPVNASGNELGFLKLRYKLPNQSNSTLISQPIATSTRSSYRLQYAAMVAAFAEHLRGGKYLGDFDLPKIESKLGSLTPATDSESGNDLMSLIGLAKRIEAPTAVEYSKR